MKFYEVAPFLQVTNATAKGSWFSFLHRYIGSNNVNTRYKMTKYNFIGLRFSEVEYQYDFSEIRTAMDELSGLVFSPTWLAISKPMMHGVHKNDRTFHWLTRIKRSTSW